MTTTFASYNALTDHIMDAILDRVPGSTLGASDRSVSRYVTVTDDDGNERRVRISDHDATASCGGGIVFEVDIRDFGMEEVYDDFGEFDGLTTEHGWKIDEAIERAVEALR